MSPNHTEPALRRRLARYRALATSLLVLMGAGVVAGLYLPHGYWAGLFRAATRAGLIGGIADWFAVTALFRRPLGLPIPHTAVIPRQKARLGRALGRFVAEHVFTESEMRRAVGRLDLPGATGRFLLDDESRAQIAARLAGAVPTMLAGVSDGHAARLFGKGLPALFEGRELGIAVARGLRGLVEGQRHQAVVGFVVGQLREMLRAKESQLRVLIEDRVRSQGGRLVGWALGGSIATRVLQAMNRELEEVDPAAPEISDAVNRWIEAQIALFEAEPGRAEELGRQIRSTLAHETVAAWSADVWDRLRTAIARDSARSDGHVVGVIDEALRRLADRLQSDATLRARLETMLAGSLGRLVPAVRTRLADFIGSVVAGWDDRATIDRLELRVGPDLQYIRMNGTLVGFAAGALVFALIGG